jgi:hypothetical protein
MKKIKFIVLSVITILIYTSCQQIFTYSVLEWAQRDPSTLPLAAQISYAEAALASGDQAAIESAYAAISSSTDPDTQALASQLAVSASGLDEAITEAITTLTFDPAVIGTIDNAWLVDAEAAMLTADTGGADITPEEYLTIAAAIIVIDAQDNHADDITAVDFSPYTAPFDQNSADPAERSLYYAAEAGFTLTELEDMFGI